MTKAVSVTSTIGKYMIDSWHGMNDALIHLEYRVSCDDYEALYYMLHGNDGYKYLSRCRECRRWFLSDRSQSQFCNSLCRSRHWRKQETEEGAIKKCLTCGLVVIGHSSKKYCDSRCRDKAYYKRKITDRYK